MLVGYSKSRLLLVSFLNADVGVRGWKIEMGKELRP